MNKIVLLITLLSPLTLTASNSNARAPESQATGTANHQGVNWLDDDNAYHWDESPLALYAARGNGDAIKQLLRDEPTTTITFLIGLGNIGVINMRTLALQYHKDYAFTLKGGYTDTLDNDEGERSFASETNYSFQYGVTGLCECHSALSLAVLGGHVDAVDILLSHLLSGEQTADAHTDRYEFISKALIALIRFSKIAQSPNGKVWFKNLGIPFGRAKLENYPIIAHKLIDAFNVIKPGADDAHVKLGQPASVSPTNRIIRDSIINALKHGSPEVTETIAECCSGPLSNQAIWLHGLNGTAQFHAQQLCSGKKLGILLSAEAHPSSAVYQLSRGLLVHAAHNPMLLERLKSYVRLLRQAHICISQHILPDVSRIVAGYAGIAMPADMIRRILRMQPSDTIVPNHDELYQNLIYCRTVQYEQNNEPMLGDHLTATLGHNRPTIREELEEKKEQ